MLKFYKSNSIDRLFVRYNKKVYDVTETNGEFYGIDENNNVWLPQFEKDALDYVLRKMDTNNKKFEIFDLNCSEDVENFKEFIECGDLVEMSKFKFDLVFKNK